MDNTKTYQVWDCNMNLLTEKVEAMNRKAVKLGLPKIESRVTGVEQVKVYYTYLDEEGNKRTTSKFYWDRKYSVELIGDALKLPGWAFVGTLQHTPAGNVIRSVPGQEIPASFREGGPKCDHCQKRRNRNDTYLVRNEQGEIKQVGHSCVRDFLGHVSPQHLAWLATMLAEMEALGGEPGSGGWGKRRIHTTEFLNICAALTLEKGFVSRAASQACKGDVPLVTTSALAFEIMFPDEGKVRKGTAPSVEITDAAIKLADDSRAWVATLSGGSDYLHNLKVISSKETLEQRDLGLIASLPAAYQKEVLKIEQQRREHKERAVSKHFGEIGQRAVFELKVSKIVTLAPSQFARREDEYRYLYLFEDAQGNRAAWFASSKQDFEEGKTYQVKASVKCHDEYKGEAQTVLARCVDEVAAQAEREKRKAAAKIQKAKIKELTKRFPAHKWSFWPDYYGRAGTYRCDCCPVTEETAEGKTCAQANLIGDIGLMQERKAV
jgi:hypothetical protein